MKSILLIVVALGILSILWSLFLGAIKWAIIIGVALVIVGALKNMLGKSD